MLRGGGGIFLFFFQVGNQVRIVKNLEVHGLFRSRQMMMADDVADLVDERLRRTEGGENLPGYRRPIDMLVFGRRTVVLAFRFLDADVVEVGGDLNDRRVALLLGGYLHGMAGHPAGMADT